MQHDNAREIHAIWNTYIFHHFIGSTLKEETMHLCKIWTWGKMLARLLANVEMTSVHKMKIFIWMIRGVAMDVAFSTDDDASHPRFLDEEGEGLRDGMPPLDEDDKEEEKEEENDDREAFMRRRRKRQ